MRITWESIDGFRPPVGNRKHIPKSKYLALDRAIAQKNNNALLMLKGPYKSPSRARAQARRHQVERTFKFKPFTTLCTRKMVEYRDITKAPLEALPYRLKDKIFEHLSYADLICLALCSSRLMDRIRSYDLDNCLMELCNGCWNEGKAAMGVWDHLTLMVRLENWMPAGLKFCHHCQIYVPEFWFDRPVDYMEDAIVCMDCKPNLPSKSVIERSSCEGCLKVSEILGVISDNHERDVFDEGVWKEVMEEWRDDKSSLIYYPDDDPLTWSPLGGDADDVDVDMSD